MASRLLVLLVLACLGGCTSLWLDLSGRNARQGVSSSLVDYLYPKGGKPPEPSQTVPELQLPLKVGLAFVPSDDPQTAGLSAAHKMGLLGRVKSAFEGREFIREIVVIPDTYLRSRKGFESIEQVSRLYGLDVIALVSYDQIVHSDDTKASILYWTIVGAYFVKGSKNDVQTFVDTAIFDVATRKLLFRAPGIDTVVAASTLVNSVEDMRRAREQGFSRAMSDMTRNLDAELELFRERVKTDQSVRIRRNAPAGGGAGGAQGLAGLLLLATAGWLRWRRRVHIGPPS